MNIYNTKNYQLELNKKDIVNSAAYNSKLMTTKRTKINMKTYGKARWEGPQLKIEESEVS